MKFYEFVNRYGLFIVLVLFVGILIATAFGVSTDADVVTWFEEPLNQMTKGEFVFVLLFMGLLFSK